MVIDHLGDQDQEVHQVEIGEIGEGTEEEEGHQVQDPGQDQKVRGQEVEVRILTEEAATDVEIERKEVQAGQDQRLLTPRKEQEEILMSQIKH